MNEFFHTIFGVSNSKHSIHASLAIQFVFLTLSNEYVNDRQYNPVLWSKNLFTDNKLQLDEASYSKSDSTKACDSNDHNLQYSCGKKVQGWILHQSTLLSNIIGSGSTLERNFWFWRLRQKSEGRYFHQRFTRWIICQYWEVSMQLVSLKMRGSVAVNGIFGLKWRHDGLKGDILEYWGTLESWFITLLYPIKR